MSILSERTEAKNPGSYEKTREENAKKAAQRRLLKVLQKHCSEVTLAEISVLPFIYRLRVDCLLFQLFD